MPITALIGLLRKAAGDAGAYAHYGATSQDIVDTALIHRLLSAAAVIETRLAKLAHIFMAQAKEHQRSVMAGRTRFQQAVPTTYGLKAAGWLSGLCRHQARLRELKPRLFVVQLGGAVGTLASLGAKGPEVIRAFAGELGLAAPVMPWHAQRDALAEFAGWLSLVSGTLGKIGGDILLLAQSEVAEARPAAGGGSSTMPQKANPIAAEVLVTLARFNAGQIATMHGAIAQEHERGGAGWMLEWLILPQMTVAAGAGLARATDLMSCLVIDAARMRANVEATNGLMMAEAATFGLAAPMPRGEAERLVGEACTESCHRCTVRCRGFARSDILSRRGGCLHRQRARRSRGDFSLSGFFLSGCPDDVGQPAAHRFRNRLRALHRRHVAAILDGDEAARRDESGHRFVARQGTPAVLAAAER